MGREPYPIYLSTKDDSIPKPPKSSSERYIETGEEYEDEMIKPIYRICTSKAFVDGIEIGLLFKENEKHLRQIRKESFDELKKLYLESEYNSIAKYWNDNIEQITDLGYNKFVENKGLRPIANLIECFEAVIEKPFYKSNQENKCIAVGNKPRHYVSFGVRVEYLEPYLNSLINGDNPPKIPKKHKITRTARDRHLMKRWRTFLGEDKVTGQKTMQIVGHRTALYDMFCEWCKITNTAKTNAIEIALELLLKEYPIESLPSLEYFEEKKKTIMDYIVDENHTTKKKNNRNGNPQISFSLEPQIIDTIDKVVKNYNKSGERAKTGLINKSQIVNIALKDYFEKRKDFTLKYGNPKLYEEFKNLKKAKEYNQ